MSQMSRQKHLGDDPLPSSELPSLSDPNQHLKALTGLRALAAGWVVFFHLSFVAEVYVPALQLFRPVYSMGFLGVDLFFALSGFILCHRYLDSLGPRLSWGKVKEFIALRFARLYPVHVFVLFLFGCLGALSYVTSSNRQWIDGFSLHSLFENLFLVHGWFNQTAEWNPLAWSVSLEWLAYLCFPVIALVLYRIANSRFSHLLLALVALAFYAPLLLNLFGLDLPPQPAVWEPKTAGLFGLNLARLMGAFGGGCVAFVVCRKFQQTKGTNYELGRKWCSAWLVIVAVVIVCVGSIGLPYTAPIIWIVSPILVFIVAVVGLAGSSIPFLRSKEMVKLGLSSYSLYMTSWLSMSLLGFAPPWFDIATRIGIPGSPIWVRVAYCVASVVIIYTVAQLCWKFIEEPARRFLRRSLASNMQERPVEERS
jgi:peptidoglycan/LPS O-acetylase OafA/YrhL